MSQIPAIPPSIASRAVDSEPSLPDFDEHFVAIEQEDLPQGVLSLILQIMPRDLPIAAPRLMPASGLAGHVNSAVQLAEGEALKPGVRESGLAMAPRFNTGGMGAGAMGAGAMLHLARLEAQPASSAIAGVLPGVIGFPAAGEADLMSEIKPTQASAVAPGSTPASTPEEPRKKTTEAGDRLPHFLASPPAVTPGINPGPAVATMPHSPGFLASGQAGVPAEGAQQAEQFYLRLPFAKDSVVGHVNVSKPGHESPVQLQLAGSSTEVTRHLSQHLASAEPTWRLADGQYDGHPQGGGTEQPADDDSDDEQEHAGHGQWQG
jgi:hypothetical protein